MTERGILELLTRRGFGVTVIFHADERVTVRAIAPDGRTLRGTAGSELQAAVRVWNRLGFAPVLRVGGQDRFAEIVRAGGSRWTQRVWGVLSRSWRPAAD